MDNEKRILLAVVLSIAVLFLYQYLSPPIAKKTAEPAKTPAAEKVTQPSQPSPSSALPQKPLAGSRLAASAQTTVGETGSSVTVDSTLFTALFSAATGSPASFKLHSYRETLEPSAAERLIMKFFPKAASAPAPQGENYKELIHAQLSLGPPLRTLFADSASGSDSVGPWQPDSTGLRLNAGMQSGAVSFSQQDPQGLILSNQYSFSDQDYRIGLTLKLKNGSGAARSGSPVIEWRTPVPSENGGGFFGGGSGDVAQFTYLLKDKVVKQELAKIKEDTPIEGDIIWTAIEEKYFMSALLMQDQKPAQVRIGAAADGIVVYQVIFPSISLQPGQEAQYQLQLYLGPKDMDILARQGAHLEKTLDFGWFDIIAKPLLLCLKFFYGFLGNYGLAIILLTIIIKILFWPLTHKSFESMKGMQKIQPELNALKEKYKNNKEEFARQQLTLYRKYNVNPLSGCLPIVIQIPVFIALYNALMYSIELRHANFVDFWINDLSAKDPTYIAPIVMGISQFLQQKMTPSTSMDPSQAKMMLFMPVIFTVMFLSFPSGLVIYWLVNNVISLAQQLYINRTISAPGGKECSPSTLKPKQSKKQ